MSIVLSSAVSVEVSLLTPLLLILTPSVGAPLLGVDGLTDPGSARNV